MEDETGQVRNADRISYMVASCKKLLDFVTVGLQMAFKFLSGFNVLTKKDQNKGLCILYMAHHWFHFVLKIDV